ncbi:MAG: M42 family peptidase [Eubacterium sp.]|jgi:endoglucanase|nr:M42 family peptidase [Eubacterium sp.]
MIQTLEELCGLNAVSGDEKDVREYIISKIKILKSDIKTDNLGNLIIFKKGRQRPKNKIMVCAHMDEVGFITSYITDDGYVKIKPVGGIMPSAVPGRRILFKRGITGAVGTKPVHKLKDVEKETQPTIEELHVDIGATDRADAEKYVSLGEIAYFVGEFFEFGDGFVSGKAIDDRIGCAIMIDMINSDLEYDAFFVFTAVEEAGARGAAPAAYSVMPDMAVVLEATTAADIPGIENGDVVCELGGGPVVSFMDNGSIYDKELYDTAFFTARENSLKCQTKTKIAGGNDGGVIHRTLGGIRTIAASVPCRYLHTANCVIKMSDAEETRILTEKLLEKASVL